MSNCGACDLGLPHVHGKPLRRIRVVFEGECGDGTNMYWIGREGDGKPIGSIRCDAGMAQRLHDLINETYYESDAWRDD